MFTHHLPHLPQDRVGLLSRHRWCLLRTCHWAALFVIRGVPSDFPPNIYSNAQAVQNAGYSDGTTIRSNLRFSHRNATVDGIPTGNCVSSLGKSSMLVASRSPNVTITSPSRKPA